VTACNRINQVIGHPVQVRVDRQGVPGTMPARLCGSWHFWKTHEPEVNCP
jgi:hypothetical protein